MLTAMTMTGTNDRATWLKFTDTHRNDVLPMAMFNEKMTLNMTTARRFDPSICFGLMVRDSKKYSCAPTMLHAMWIVDNAYGYLKSTLANAALFSTVTKMLLAIHTSNQNAIATVDVFSSVPPAAPGFVGTTLTSAGGALLPATLLAVLLLLSAWSVSASNGVSLLLLLDDEEDEDDEGAVAVEGFANENIVTLAAALILISFAPGVAPVLFACFFAAQEHGSRCGSTVSGGPKQP